jgi:hypothetical protein
MKSQLKHVYNRTRALIDSEHLLTSTCSLISNILYSPIISNCSSKITGIIIRPLFLVYVYAIPRSSVNVTHQSKPPSRAPALHYAIPLSLQAII